MPAALTPAWSPSPTPPPSPPNSPLKRDVANAGLCGFKLSVAGFNTYTNPWSCSASSTCMWNTDISAVGCCYTGQCDFHTSCIESTALGRCGSACRTNTLNLLCTDSVTQYCATATFEGDYFLYLCEPSPSWWWTIALTPQGQTTGPSGIPRFTGGNAVPTKPVTITSSSSFPPSNSPSPGPQSKNVGAIAGGTVGGLAGLCLSGLAIAFLILRYRRRVRVVPPVIAEGQLPTLNNISTMAELSPVSVQGELGVEHKAELDGKFNTMPTMIDLSPFSVQGEAAAELDGTHREDSDGKPQE